MTARQNYCPWPRFNASYAGTLCAEVHAGNTLYACVEPNAGYKHKYGYCLVRARMPHSGRPGPGFDDVRHVWRHQYGVVGGM
jgi:hypothetical protein